MREVKLPSGAILMVGLAPFAEAKALYQAVLEEAKQIPFGRYVDVTEVLKNIICFSYSSGRIEKCLNECMKRCTYDDGSGKGAMKIDKDTFEPEAAREDYPVVCYEVASENIRPFAKSLSVVFEKLSAILPSDPT